MGILCLPLSPLQHHWQTPSEISLMVDNPRLHSLIVRTNISSRRTKRPVKWHKYKGFFSRGQESILEVWESLLSHCNDYVLCFWYSCHSQCVVLPLKWEICNAMRNINISVIYIVTTISTGNDSTDGYNELTSWLLYLLVMTAVIMNWRRDYYFSLLRQTSSYF
jgi:hypothetical protein